MSPRRTRYRHKQQLGAWQTNLTMYVYCTTSTRTDMCCNVCRTFIHTSKGTKDLRLRLTLFHREKFTSTYDSTSFEGSMHVLLRFARNVHLAALSWCYLLWANKLIWRGALKQNGSDIILWVRFLRMKIKKKKNVPYQVCTY